MMTTDSFQPLQLKGEIMDLEFTVDTDHRKRRRNRTTQSCLNCHTSKRKCDRKRPCQRCIQLGLTGLCVYEIDDPALRDDPSVDENTRLRNRIAELESLVRELRGKPHPRWAETSFRDGDPNEKWHSRATKCASIKRRAQSPENGLNTISTRALPSLLSPIKTEPATDASPQLYRFSPSPAPSIRYHTFQTDLRSPSTSSFGDDHTSFSTTPSTVNGASTGGASAAAGYHAPSSPSVAYHHHAHPGHQHHHGQNGAAGSLPSSYTDNGNGSYALSANDENGYGEHFNGAAAAAAVAAASNANPGAAPTGATNGSASPSASPASSYCSCRTSPGTGIAFIGLAQQLQNSLNSIRQYSHHPANTQCLLYRRIVELNNLMRGSDAADASYDNNIADRDILTPASASSGHTSFHTGSSGGVSPQEWNAIAAAGYNPYFPVQPDHNAIYTHVMT